MDANPYSKRSLKSQLSEADRVRFIFNMYASYVHRQHVGD